MTERIAVIFLSLILLFLLIVLPFILKSANIEPKYSQDDVTVEVTTNALLALEVLPVEKYPSAVNFPDDYALIYQVQDTNSQVTILEKGKTYLVQDTNQEAPFGMYVTMKENKYYYCEWIAGTNSWTAEKAVSADKDTKFMENGFTKDRWTYPKKFYTDVVKDYKPSEKPIYIKEPEKVSGVLCNHYVAFSAWYEFEYWVDPDTNVTLKYSKVDTRLGERTVLSSYEAKEFNKKPDFSKFISVDVKSQ